MTTPPEKKKPTESLDTARKIAETRAGERPPDERCYPYIPTDYDIPSLHIGTERQLFVDNFILDHLDGVERVFPTPERPETAILEFGDLPWEDRVKPHPVAALQDPDSGKFKLWYVQSIGDDPFGDSGMALCYAESDDCLHWEKMLSDKGLPFEGHTATNIVLHDSGHHIGLVLNRDQTDPARKYLMVYNPHDRARAAGKATMSTVLASPDGLAWTEISADTPYRHHHYQRVIWDESIQKWIAYSQYSHHWNFLYRKRQVGRQESADFIEWSPKEVVLSIDDEPNLPPHLEFHDMSVRKIGGLYLGIVGEFMAEPLWSTEDGRNWRDHAHAHLGLYASRDGKRWSRVGGPGPWVDNRGPGSSDYGFLTPTVAGQLLYDGNIHIPYLASPDKQHWFDKPFAFNIVPEADFQRARAEWQALDQAHGQWPTRNRSIGTLILREDGWARLQPVYERGRVITRQFVFEGEQLHINADVHGGFIRVEILDPDFKAYAGFSADDCTPISGDDTWHTVHWKGDLRRLWNKPVRLIFHLNQTSLYSFEFTVANK